LILHLSGSKSYPEYPKYPGSNGKENKHQKIPQRQITDFFKNKNRRSDREQQNQEKHYHRNAP